MEIHREESTMGRRYIRATAHDTEVTAYPLEWSKELGIEIQQIGDTDYGTRNCFTWGDLLKITGHYYSVDTAYPIEWAVENSEEILRRGGVCWDYSGEGIFGKPLWADDVRKEFEDSFIAALADLPLEVM